MYPSSATATATAAAAAAGGGGEAAAAAQCSGCSAALPRAALGRAGILMFVGTAETRDLCARCTLEYYYRTGGLGIGSSSTSSTSHAHATCPFAFAAAATTAPAAAKNKNAVPPMRPKSNRCGACPKKVGLLGFACRRCGGTFCSAHRHAESHGCCSFDYRGFAREAGASESNR